MQGLLDDRVAAAADLEGEAAVDDGAHETLVMREMGERRRVIQLGKRRCDVGQRALLGATAAANSLKISCSIASARSAAEAIRPSVSDNSGVMKRMALAMLWRWRKVSDSGGSVSGLALACVTAMK